MLQVNKIYVIGIGYKPLEKKAGEIVLNSEVVLTSTRLFEVFKGYEEYEMVKERVKVINNVNETIDFIKSHISEIKNHLTLLASGDPLFCGIGRRVIKEFGKDRVEILPDLSSIQIAFSRTKEPWDNAFLMSLHGGHDPEKRRRLEHEMEDIPFLLEKYKKIAILTDKVNNPSAIAKSINSSLITRHSSLVTMYVCEKLGYSDEKITEGTPMEISEMVFSEPNVVIIQKKEDGLENKKNLDAGLKNSDIRFGLNEKEIVHSRGLITKDEVRAATIHRLRLPQTGVFWDIGSGSGSVSIEVARLFPSLKVFAIEKDIEQINNIKRNKVLLGVYTMEIMEGEAPETLEAIPSPDGVFIGGSGGRLEEIINYISQRMNSGVIVINATTIETLYESVHFLEKDGFHVEVTEVSVARAKIIGKKRHMSALNPVFIISGER